MPAKVSIDPLSTIIPPDTHRSFPFLLIQPSLNLKVSNWTFNDYFGTVSRTLEECATRSSVQDLMIKKKLSKADIAAKKRPYDVARFACSIALEEVFEFRLSFDNWTFKSEEEHPDAANWDKKRVKLQFIVPKHRYAAADASRRYL